MAGNDPDKPTGYSDKWPAVVMRLAMLSAESMPDFDIDFDIRRCPDQQITIVRVSANPRVVKRRTHLKLCAATA
jgi:hypothetical protein